MITFFYFLLIIGSVFSTICTSYTKCTSCLDDFDCEWCETNKHCYDSVSDYDYCSDWKHLTSSCPGYMATIFGAVFGGLAGLIILIACCVYCSKKAQKRRLEEYRKSGNTIGLQPVTIQQPSYQQPSYQQPTYQEPTYQPTYQEPTYQEPSYQQPTYQPSYQQPTYQEQNYQQQNYQESNLQLGYQEPNYQGPDNNYQNPVGMNFPDFSTYNPQQNQYQNN
ncbi:hypothetical protein M0811_12525 [Anaeramoeba ignava]|uniref:PSI domain-containing protein n=1 Tax=Anaeramoeba ignava TaxID=1746090 RepID=A0A9Q0R6Y7_ANAIG|nr:hypothetical protein M0811_12525 [Anaeramoeba ignava]